MGAAKEPAGRPSVVLVDDSEVSREAARRVLERSGFSAHVVDPSDGVERLVTRIQPDVILLDVGMLAADTATLCRRMKEWIPGARVGLFSALSDQRLVALAGQSGADGYFSKLRGYENLPAWLRSFAVTG